MPEVQPRSSNSIPERNGESDSDGERAVGRQWSGQTARKMQPNSDGELQELSKPQDTTTILPQRLTEQRVLSRTNTRDSLTQSISTQRSNVQLLSSLMAGSSDDGEDGSVDSNESDLRQHAGTPEDISTEGLAELLFSTEHMKVLLHNPALLSRLTSFVYRYRSEDFPVLKQYVDMSKAKAAIEYANALIADVSVIADQESRLQVVNQLDPAFQTSYNIAFEKLLSNALPIYVTYDVVKVVSECLENEITGKLSSVARGLIGGLSEIFCLTDPNLEDNPIIYASDEFYRFTGYGRDEVLGRNCRFLQGPRTNRSGPARLKASVSKGEEVSEILLNYRRDGRAFLNLLMLAPLYDNRGKVRYHIGAQVDVSGLIEKGYCLEGFRALRKNRDKARQRSQGPLSHDQLREPDHSALSMLKNLSELFNHEETAMVQSISRPTSTDHASVMTGIDGSITSNPFRDISSSPDPDHDGQYPLLSREGSWQLGSSGPDGPSGKLPGVYEKYILIKPAPSLRVTFVSPKMQTWGNLVQSPFMSHLAADSSVLTELNNSFKTGTPVSARVRFMPKRGSYRGGTPVSLLSHEEKVKVGKPCSISATPLTDRDGRPGVWMVVFVETIKGSENVGRQGVFGRTIGSSEFDVMNRRMLRRQSYQRSLSTDLPIKPKRLDGREPSILTSPKSQSDYFSKGSIAHHDQSEKIDSQSTRQSSSPPTANESRKASPRRQAIHTPQQSPSGRVHRKRLSLNSDSEDSMMV